MLEVRGLTAGYGQSVVLHVVSLEFRAGRIGCLLGRNGVGKTTLLKTIVGLIRPTAGRVLHDGEEVTNVSIHQRARAGLAYVPQGRGIFPYLSVYENLSMGFESARAGRRRPLEEICELFPTLEQMGARRAGPMSGGQQQQLAIARALVGQPKVLLLDEPTEGLQPSIIWEIERVIDGLRQRRELAILLVEQFVEFALDLADDYRLIERGTIVSRGLAVDLSESVIRQYLAV